MNDARKKKFIIGLTGTIGSGKSLVADILGELGADIVDTDIIAREVVEPGTEGLKTITDRWGDKALHSDGTLDRNAVAQIVFNDDDERKWLNEVLHPLIGHETARRVQDSKSDVVVLVVPLLFESGMDAMVDESWMVASDESALLDRIVARDKCSREEALARIVAQMPQEEKKKRADVIIENSGSIEETRTVVEEAWRRIEKL